MRRICFLLLAGLLAVSCGQDGFNRLKINVDKALKRPVKSVELYAKADVIPLGVIYAGNNYYCCPAARLPEFLPDAPADGGEELVIIRYALLASDLAVFRPSGRSKGKEQTAYEKSDAEDLLCGAAGRGPVRM